MNRKLPLVVVTLLLLGASCESLDKADDIIDATHERLDGIKATTDKTVAVLDRLVPRVEEALDLVDSAESRAASRAVALESVVDKLRAAGALEGGVANMVSKTAADPETRPLLFTPAFWVAFLLAAIFGIDSLKNGKIKDLLNRIARKGTAP